MTSLSDTYTTTSLKELGLTEYEALVYQACLKRGELTIMELAKTTSISRTTIYGVADELVKKGLIRFIQKGAHRIYSAEDPHKLDTMLEKAKVELDRKGAFLSSILPSLAMQYMATDSKPVVSYYQGQVEVRQIFEECLRAKPEEILFIGEAATIEEALGPRYLQAYVKKRIASGIPTRGIRTSETEVMQELYEPGKHHLRKLRLAPKGMIAPVYTGIYNNKVFFISSLKESYGVQIESREMANMLRSWFEVMWKASKD
jgi:sugar-specific transcriptional regulator TrmB